MAYLYELPMLTKENTTVTVTVNEMQDTFQRILFKHGFATEKAKLCAEIFTSNTVDGVYTHGVYRFAKFVQYIKEGWVKKDASPVMKSRFGGIEQWDGNLGPGIINALEATDTVMSLARRYGIGCVALSNTNHWMRGGTYGWRAAKAGFVFIGWTNTIANMPAWGARDGRLGNNPLIMALPYKQEAIIIDMAMSQFSFGAMELATLKNEKLSVYGGYNSDDQLTDDPASIIKTRRPLPIGYWKGAGLALLLDLLATILSGGLSTVEITKRKVEYGLSQVFIAIDISKLPHHSTIPAMIENIIGDYMQSVPENDKSKIVYPGERVLQTRKRNREEGIAVVKKAWEEIIAL
jgi:3-dehydro-L-gulonate 2-dehydrogenase